MSNAPLETAYDQKVRECEKLADRIEELERDIIELGKAHDFARSRYDALQADNARLREIATQLWDIIDDIDTYGDMAKSDDVLFRRLTENRQRDRWKTGITIDGQTLLFPTPEQSLAALTERIRAEAFAEVADKLEALGNRLNAALFTKEPE